MIDLLHSHAVSTGDPIVSGFLQLGLYFHGMWGSSFLARPTISDNVTRIVSIGSSNVVRISLATLIDLTIL